MGPAYRTERLAGGRSVVLDLLTLAARQHTVHVEAVIDTDRASAVLARDLAADTLVIATDTVYAGWGTAAARAGLDGSAGTRVTTSATGITHREGWAR